MIVGVDSIAPEKIRPLKRDEYDKLVALGAFAEEKVELLYGTIVAMTPQGVPHAFTIQRLSKRLMFAVSDRAMVRVQLPLALGDSEPEPDLAVVPPGDYSKEHPSQ